MIEILEKEIKQYQKMMMEKDIDVDKHKNKAHV